MVIDSVHKFCEYRRIHTKFTAKLLRMIQCPLLVGRANRTRVFLTSSCNASIVSMNSVKARDVVSNSVASDSEELHPEKTESLSEDMDDVDNVDNMLSS